MPTTDNLSLLLCEGRGSDCVAGQRRTRLTS